MKEYIEKLRQLFLNNFNAYAESNLGEHPAMTEEKFIEVLLDEYLAAAPSPVIDLSGVTNDGMPALPDGLNDDSNVDYNFKVGWIACWKAFTQSGQQAPEPVEEKKECEIGICWAEAVTNINGINVCGFHANQQL
jgi:hypothetical protein